MILSVNDVEMSPLALESFLMAGLIVLFVAVLARRTVELLQQRYRLSKLQRFWLTFVILCAYLALPVGLQLNERFAPALVPFTSPFMFLALCVLSYAGAVGFYRVLGGKPKRVKEQ
jgi:hypothetical protein